MSKDLTRRADITNPEQTKIERTRGKQTEVERAQEALAERMLFGTSSRPQQDDLSRIILVLDCTISMGEYIEERRITLAAARSIAYSLFAKQPGLRVRVAFFRGYGDKNDQSAKHPQQLQFSKGTTSLRSWHGTSPRLSIGRAGHSTVGSCVLSLRKPRSGRFSKSSSSVMRSSDRRRADRTAMI
jgi:hypothetical protein